MEVNSDVIRAESCFMKLQDDSESELSLLLCLESLPYVSLKLSSLDVCVSMLFWATSSNRLWLRRAAPHRADLTVERRSMLHHPVIQRIRPFQFTFRTAVYMRSVTVR